MNHRCVLVLAFLMAATISGARASAQGCMTFASALSTASERDPGVHKAQADLRGARADMDMAKSLSRPQISAYARSSSGEQGATNAAFNNEVGLRASQRLFDFGDARLARKAASHHEEARRLEVADAQGRAAYEVGLAYIDWLEATAELESTGERQAYFERELTSLRSALEIGGVTRAGVAEVAAEAASAQSARLELQLKRDRALAQLRLMTGFDLPPCRASTAAVLKGPDADRVWRMSSQELQQTAIETNPGVDALRALVESQDANRRRQARERLPAIEVVGLASRASEQLSGGSDERYWVGIEVNVPLLSGGALSARKEGSIAQSDRAFAELAELTRTLREQAAEAHLSVAMLERQVEEQSRVTGFRTEEFDAVSEEYDQAVSTVTRLVDARLELEREILEEVRLRHDLLRARLTVLSLLGMLVD